MPDGRPLPAPRDILKTRDMSDLPVQPSRVLIVDDDRLNREILVEFLDGEGYELATAEDGEQALAVLAAHDQVFDTVLLDRMMPGIDGMEVLRRMKRTPVLRWLPVIMQTAAAAREQVLEGIEAGAFYYLTKPFDMEMLRSLVRSAVESSRIQRGLRTEVEQHRVMIGMMTRASFSIRTPEEARRLAVLVANAAPEPDHAVLGLSELLLNAIEHGNLGLSYDDKSRLRENGTFEAEIARRLSLPEYAQRSVTLEFRRKGASVEVLITDQGNGFDWRPYLEIDATRAFHVNGRGIALARMLSFRSLEYLGKGNQVLGLLAPRAAPAADETPATKA
jgi:CheY-like chemotaxis protein/anti-sigma regulatory factor (Ser/Thr protein kinase)